jgi:hypothetical protein
MPTDNNAADSFSSVKLTMLEPQAFVAHIYSLDFSDYLL